VNARSEPRRLTACKLVAKAKRSDRRAVGQAAGGDMGVSLQGSPTNGGVDVVDRICPDGRETLKKLG